MRLFYGQRTVMRTSVVSLLLTVLVSACDPESSPDFDRPDFDRVEFVAAGDDTTDEGDAEETGDAGMDGVEPLPDAGVPDSDPCCFCVDGPLPECLPMNAEECAAYEAASGLESCDPTLDDCQCS